LKKTIDATRSCGHGPITPEEEDAYNKIVQWALMYLKRFHVHITNETGEIRFRDENGLLQQREMGTSSKSVSLASIGFIILIHFLLAVRKQN
jgi:hypothetical protein